MSVCSGRYMIMWPIHTYTQTYMHADIHAHRQMYNHSIHLQQSTLHFTISLSAFLGLLLCNSGDRLIGSIGLHTQLVFVNELNWVVIVIDIIGVWSDWSVLCFVYVLLMLTYIHCYCLLSLFLCDFSHSSQTDM